MIEAHSPSSSMAKCEWIEFYNSNRRLIINNVSQRREIFQWKKMKKKSLMRKKWIWEAENRDSHNVQSLVIDFEMSAIR